MDPGAMLNFDRSLFAFTIGAHILLVCTSVSLIALISVAEFVSIRRREGQYEALARRLSRVFVVSFGVGTASGIVMAVELVALFPGFMTLVAQTGAIVVLYFEVFAFFLEVLALVLYVYYWDSFSGRYTHWAVSLLVATGTILSAVFITMVNAWMNTPNGFDTSAYLASGLKTVSSVDPWAAFLTVSTLSQVLHVLVTTVLTGSMALGCYFAYWLVRASDTTEKAIASKALKLLGAFAILMVILAGVSGSHEMATLLIGQPLKYAALDANPLPGTNMPEQLFGGVVNGAFQGGITVPGMQSLLAQLETGITILPGLSEFTQSTWPPLFVHTTFNIMIVGGFVVGFFLLALFLGLVLRRRPFESRTFAILWIPVAIVAVVVYELGWATDEIGRQPWIVYNVMTVGQAANLSQSLVVPGVMIVLFYLLVVPATFYVFARVYRGDSKPEGGVQH